MTTNVTRLVMDFGEVLLSRSPDGAAQALRRGKQTAAAMLGFAGGCALGAVTEMAAGLWALALPTGLALVALAMALAARLDGRP
jgi:uncharacterized membrane protein YoaK (UPF0700 family)